VIRKGVWRRPPPAHPLYAATEFRGKFLFRLQLSVVLAPSLFIASPPSSRSSISDANSCKLPSSLLLVVAPATFLAHDSTCVPSRGDLTPSPSRTRPMLPFFGRSGINHPQPRNYFEDLPEILEIIPPTCRYLFAILSKQKLSNVLSI
jgi:hypothetical protein